MRFEKFFVERGFPFRKLDQSRAGHLLEWGLLDALAGFLEDPDAEVVKEIHGGVALGFQEDLPRTPTVWGLKQKWNVPAVPVDDFKRLNSNYPSAE
eukprot:2792567-Amphidinium_carterae.1